MKNNQGLRTTGTHTGNFGKAKVKGNPGELLFTKEILQMDDLRIAKRDDAYNRLVEAYNKTTDPRLKAGLADMIKRHKATITQNVAKPVEEPPSEYWEMIKRTR